MPPRREAPQPGRRTRLPAPPPLFRAATSDIPVPGLVALRRLLLWQWPGWFLLGGLGLKIVVVLLEPVEELLLGTDRLLKAVPPSPPQARGPGVVAEAVRGPSLFERMAMAARGAVVQRGREIDPVAARRGPVFLDRRHAA